MIFENMISTGVRRLVMDSYAVPRYFYAKTKHSAAYEIGNFGCLMWYAMLHPTRGREVKAVKVDKMVEQWRVAIVGLATAHDKDEADRYEASIEALISPMLTAPVKQIREFSRKLRDVLKKDDQVPFLVWRAYEVWVNQVLEKAKDQGVIQLKTDLAKEIAELVEEDVQAQLPDALVRALQWRGPETLEKVKEVVQEEKAKGRKVRLRGRESCLFLEAGGSEEEPKVCVQI